MIMPHLTIDPEWLEYDIDQREWVLKDGAPQELVEKYNDYLRQKAELKAKGYR